MLTPEQKTISKKCKHWAYKIAQEKAHPIFRPIARKRTLAQCYPGFTKLKGMKKYHRNIIVFDLDKIKEGDYDIEHLTIHECIHLKPGLRNHNSQFAAEMKKWTGEYSWEHAKKRDVEVSLT